jgi:hypothetical protein
MRPKDAQSHTLHYNDTELLRPKKKKLNLWPANISKPVYVM